MGLFDFLKPKPSPKANETPNITVTVSTPTAEDFARQQEEGIREIRRLEKAAYPSENGLKPHEIMLLSYAPRYKTSGNSFQQFWRYQYAIENPQKMLNSLAERGFIREATAAESLNALKASDLKEILSAKGLKTTGKKADLVSRVAEALTEDELGRRIPARQYALTELGARELEENQYVTYFGYHTKYGLTVWDMNKMLRNYPKKQWRDRIWGYLNEKVDKAAERIEKSLDYGAYAYARGEICNFLMEEGRNPEMAFDAFNEETYLECCLLKPSQFLYEYGYYRDIGKKFGYEEPVFRIYADGHQYFKFQEILRFSDEQMRQVLIGAFRGLTISAEVFKHHGVPQDLFSAENLAALVMAAIADDNETAEQIRLDAEKRLKRLKPRWKTRNA